MPSSSNRDGEEVIKLRQELARQREETAELRGRFAALGSEMQRKKIESFEELAEQDKEAKKVLLQLAQETKPAPLQGVNIALFGLTSTGKSTMLNALLGKKNTDPGAAQTGVGETTQKIKAYPGTGFTLWDVPGRNDEVSYLSMEYVSFFKGLTRRLILITATVKENSSMMKLLDELGLKYSIVFNKFDKVEEEEQSLVKEQIQKEINSLGLRHVETVYFVSAKNVKMFDDWRKMVDTFTG